MCGSKVTCVLTKIVIGVDPLQQLTVGVGVQPQKIVIGVGFRWFAGFLDPPTSNFQKNIFFAPPYSLSF